MNTNREALGHNIALKGITRTGSPKLSIINCIFYSEDPHPGTRKRPFVNILCGIKPREKNEKYFQEQVVECRDNTFIYLWDRDISAVPLWPGFTLIQEEKKGRAMWKNARDKWLKDHPNVRRVPGVDI